MGESVKSYQDLDVWNIGIDLVLRIYAVVGRLPPSERFELSAQMRRAVVSVPSNIAEGHARRRPKPYLNHVEIALGSLAELVTCLVVARRLGFLTQAEFDEETRGTDRVGQMLHGLSRSLARRVGDERLGIALGTFSGWLVLGAMFSGLFR